MTTPDRLNRDGRLFLQPEFLPLQKAANKPLDNLGLLVKVLQTHGRLDEREKQSLRNLSGRVTVRLGAITHDIEPCQVILLGVTGQNKLHRRVCMKIYFCSHYLCTVDFIQTEREGFGLVLSDALDVEVFQVKHKVRSGLSLRVAFRVLLATSNLQQEFYVV